MHKKLIALVASLLFFGSALSALALTQAEKDALIQQIMAQIAALQAQVNQQSGALNAAPVAWCHAFNVGLGYANSGSDEVVALHSALQKEAISYSPDNVNTYSVATAKAVAKFQAKYGISQTGYVGPLTRKKLNQLYGCLGGVTSTSPLSLIYPNGGQTLRVGDSARITWTSTGLAANDRLIISAYLPSDPYLNVKTITSYVQASQGYYDWNISNYNLPSTSFPVQLRVRLEVAGKSISATSTSDFTVNAATTNQTSNNISLTYPTGGQTLYVGDSARITWTSNGLSSSDKITISIYSPANPYTNVKTIGNSVPATQGYYDWSILANNLPSTSYPVQFKIKLEVVGKNISSSSTSDFTVNSGTNQGLASISIIYPNGGETLQVGQAPRISWATTGFSSSDRVTITVFLSDNPYVNVKTITSSVPATQGYYDWPITKYNVPGSAFPLSLKIKVESAVKNISATSASAFTVTEPPTN